VDDVGERLAALEATLHVEIRRVHERIDLHISGLAGDIARIHQALDHLHETMEQRMRAIREVVQRDIQVQVEFPKWVAKLIVGTILTAVFLAGLTFLLKPGAESRRSYEPPTTPWTGGPQ
jgi:hypothetical protein